MWRPSAGCWLVCGAFLLAVGVFLSDRVTDAQDKRSNRAGGPALPAQEAEPLVDSKAEAAGEHPLQAALRMARESEQALASVKGYHATFTKQERIGRKMVGQKMHMKIREEPFSVYLRFMNPHAGREVIYVEGRNSGKILAHETGLKSLVGTVSLLPTEPRAMEDNRYPITTIGMRKMVAKVIVQWEADTKLADCSVKLFPDAKLGEVECQVIESTHAAPRKELQFQVTRLFLDKKNNFPVRVEQYGFPSKPGMPPVLIEEYTYSNLVTSVDLKDMDFDPRHPNYDFAE